MEENRKEEDNPQVQAVWFAAGMAVLIACMERAVVVSIFEQWRVWVFLTLNLLLLAILFTSTTCSTSTPTPTPTPTPTSEGDRQENNTTSSNRTEVKIERKIICRQLEAADSGGDPSESGGGGDDEDEKLSRLSKEELNERVEAFIAMFRQHLVSDSMGRRRRNRFH